MKRYNLIYGIILVAIMESASLKCNAQSYIPLDWETTRGIALSYDFSQEYLGSISCFGTPYWGEGMYYHSFGIGIPRSIENIRYSASVPDTIITKLTMINGDTTQFDFMRFNRDTIITDYSFGYIYYEPGINLGRYITVSCKLGLSLSCSQEIISGTPAYTSDITIITESSYSHTNSSSSGISGKKNSKFGVGVLLAPNIIGHIPISEEIRMVVNVGYNVFLPSKALEITSKSNGWSVGLGLEWVLD